MARIMSLGSRPKPSDVGSLQTASHDGSAIRRQSARTTGTTTETRGQPCGVEGSAPGPDSRGRFAVAENPVTGKTSSGERAQSTDIQQ